MKREIGREKCKHEPGAGRVGKIYGERTSSDHDALNTLVVYVGEECKGSAWIERYAERSDAARTRTSDKTR